MGSLISWPVGIGTTHREPMSGPRTVGAGSSESTTGWVQTTSSPYGLWRWQFALPPLRGAALRRWRGMVTALHGGANAVRVQMRDPDGMTIAETGVSVSRATILSGLPWSDGQIWDTGRNWPVARPLVSIGADASRWDTYVDLVDEFWGRDLQVGDMFGFDRVFALHVVTEVTADGVYRVWPPLLADITTDDKATLEPMLAMRLEGESGANLPRGVSHAEGLTITLVEVEHADVLTYFAD